MDKLYQDLKKVDELINASENQLHNLLDQVQPPYARFLEQRAAKEHRISALTKAITDVVDPGTRARQNDRLELMHGDFIQHEKNFRKTEKALNDEYKSSLERLKSLFSGCIQRVEDLQYAFWENATTPARDEVSSGVSPSLALNLAFY